MKRHCPSSSLTGATRQKAPKYSRGLSLIELMVSLTIGLILMVAVISAYLGASAAARMAEAQGRMNEDANAALTILTQQLRMAGDNPKRANYSDNPPRNPVYNTATYAIRGCDGTFSDVSSAANIESLTCGGGGGTAPDSLALSYEADPFNTVKTAGGLATDCLGSGLTSIASTVNIWNGSASIPTAVSYTVADNRFYIATSAAITSPSLYCKGSATAVPQPLVENIEDMQFFYGTAAANSTSTAVVGYLDASSVLSSASLAALSDDPARWAKVASVRICILVRSEAQVVDNAASAGYVQCDGTLNNNPPDLRLRRAYSTTVVLRNRLIN